MKKAKGLTCCRIFNLFIGQLFLICACLLWICQEQIREYITYTALRPTPGMRSYHFWGITDPSPIMDIYMFNWTNAQDLYKKDVVPNFQQVGPYRFRRTREKFDIVFNENETVSFKIREWYEFFEEGSQPLTDVITTINALPAVAAYRSRFSSSFQKTMKSITLSSLSSVTMTHSVNELLFGGFEDNLLDIARPFSYVTNEKIEERFGFLMQKNGSQLGSAFNSYVGPGKDFGRMLEYDYSNVSAFYRGDCGKFRGSSSEFYPRNIKLDFVEMFITDLCTSARLDYERDVEIEGISGYRYTSKYIFDNGDELPENRCFCSEDGCMPNGVFNISLCSQNSPTFASLPHFYNADPYYRTIISGMKPDKDKHEFFMVLDPVTGITFNYGVRAQMNFRLQPYDGFGFYDGVPDIIVPVLYMDETGTLHDEILLTLYILQNMPTYMMYTYYTLFLLGFSILAYAVFSIYKNYNRRKY